jgi:predicted small metal-binding protein
MTRKFIDCRDMPSEKKCDLKMSGSEEHLLPAAVNHAVTAHGHQDTQELKEEIRKMLKDEE